MTHECEICSRLEHVKRYMFRIEPTHREGDLVVLEDKAGQWVVYEDMHKEVGRALSNTSVEDKQPRMQEEEFNNLLNGPMAHPFPMLMIGRLSMALFHVVNKTGGKGAQALREYCDERQTRDDANADAGGD